MRRGLLPTVLVLALLVAVHVVATGRTDFALSPQVREAVGASAATVFSRLHAQFSAPFFHEGIFHLLYNSALFALGLPVAVRAYGGRALPLAYLASPVAGILVDVLLVLPLAAAGVAPAVAAAPERLVGASVVAWAAIGLALAAHAPRRRAWWWALLGGIVAYESLLALAGFTHGFVWAYHLTGFALGFLVAPRFVRPRR